MIEYLNESHIPDSPLRKRILDEAWNFIGRLYAYDRHDRYLAIDKFTHEVWLTNSTKKDSSSEDVIYYDAINLAICQPNSQALEPNQLAIDAITLDFSPIAKLENFRITSKKSILEFCRIYGIPNEAIITFDDGSFVAEVHMPDDLKSAESTEISVEELDSDECKFYELKSVPLKRFVRMRGNSIIIDEFKLLQVAIDSYFEN